MMVYTEDVELLLAEDRTTEAGLAMVAPKKNDLVSYGFCVSSYISKPVKFEELAKGVSELEPYWLLINHRHSG